MTTLQSAGVLNKVKDQSLYKDLPTIGAEKLSLRITLNKAVQFINERGYSFSGSEGKQEC